MSGVRERKQQETREGILQAAKELFLEKGYESTTMEQIAEKAIVGAGTLYNYFASKDDIFLSVMSNEILRNVDQDVTEDDIGDSGAEEALCKYLGKFINAFKLFRKSLWQDTMSMIFSKSGSSLFMKWLAFDMSLITSLERKLEEFKKDGYFHDSFDCAAAAFSIYSVMLTLFMLYIYTDDMTIDTYAENVKQQIKFILSGK